MNTVSSNPVAAHAIGPRLFALSLGAFAIGLSEFVIMGLLPQVASALHVSLAEGSRFISYYALGWWSAPRCFPSARRACVVNTS